MLILEHEREAKGICLIRELLYNCAGSSLIQIHEREPQMAVHAKLRSRNCIQRLTIQSLAIVAEVSSRVCRPMSSARAVRLKSQKAVPPMTSPLRPSNWASASSLRKPSRRLSRSLVSHSLSTSLFTFCFSSIVFLKFSASSSS